MIIHPPSHFLETGVKKIRPLVSEKQDGGIGKYTAPPHITRTDRKSMARKSDTKEIKNKHSSRLVGGAEKGIQGGEDSRCHGGTETGGVWDEQGRQSKH